MTLNVTTTLSAKAGIVTIAGDIDGSTAPQAQEQILALAEPSARLVLDMSGVSFMSSAGLRMLLVTYRTVSAKGGRAVLVGLSEDLSDTMSQTGFLDFFAHYDTVDAALASLDQP